MPGNWLKSLIPHYNTYSQFYQALYAQICVLNCVPLTPLKNNECLPQLFNQKTKKIMNPFTSYIYIFQIFNPLCVHYLYCINLFSAFLELYSHWDWCHQFLQYFAVLSRIRKPVRSLTSPHHHWDLSVTLITLICLNRIVTHVARSLHFIFKKILSMGVRIKFQGCHGSTQKKKVGNPYCLFAKIKTIFVQCF